MMLSTEYVKASRIELARLEKSRSKLTAEIDAKIAALRAVLSQPQRNSASRGFEAIPALPNAKMGISSAIEEVLSKHPKGLRTREVAQYLRESGFKVSGKIGLNDRVAGEIARLFKKKKLKRSQGVYRLTAKALQSEI